MLLNSIKKCIDKNFAYFVRFDADRINGTEYLFVSNKNPIMINENAIDKLNCIDEYLKNSSMVPMFVTYDFVDSIYPDIGIKKSSWPSVAMLIPEKVYTGKIVRNNSTKKIKNESIMDNNMEKIVSEIINRIKNGELLQMVISKRFDVDGFNAISLLRNFLEYDKSMYVYYYKFGDMEIIGSSPENLFTLNGNEIMIDPIAGTRKRGNDEIEDLRLEKELLSDEKELLEHRMLVDLARNDLGKICIPGSVRVVKSMTIEKFSTVQHIVSQVTGKLKTEKLGDILGAVFPAGTVSGAPKKRAMQLINLYEEKPRGPYAGTLGIVGKNYADMALLIRSLYKNKDGSYIQAGAGIVKDSIPENEIHEMYSKALTVIGGLYEKDINN
ncbi:MULTISPECIES: anthranilate synthase component I [Acidiplasma]|jgi:anthranilate synthase component 1|uniref:anthranilate synthase n=3 Tax=Acidiplasma TaxID=507753 RepID=A0A0Q0VWP0_9ARCH|nr:MULTISPECIES: anthranilate synthase component I [Acidiplasma]KJE49055.1 hypothetical protein TZ01_07370 [Acidiplasma sp. MBA-1]KPV47167.1 hypothetical protein SE19_02185 [Acidiplasma aeolicum]KQB34440.1 hypothetical protein AOG54_04965 [Acidiplasma aeolicum]KQB36074.1 hypothetical protein AOG55_05190 [Acidiplasma cupricumulans]WMT54502.1 MAG: anthranilate synthase component I [Acidiplasma sp.]